MCTHMHWYEMTCIYFELLYIQLHGWWCLSMANNNIQDFSCSVLENRIITNAETMISWSRCLVSTNIRKSARKLCHVNRLTEKTAWRWVICVFMLKIASYLIHWRCFPHLRNSKRTLVQHKNASSFVFEAYFISVNFCMNFLHSFGRFENFTVVFLRSLNCRNWGFE